MQFTIAGNFRARVLNASPTGENVKEKQAATEEDLAKAEPMVAAAMAALVRITCFFSREGSPFLM